MEKSINLENLGILCENQEQKDLAFEFFKSKYNLKRDSFYNREFKYPRVSYTLPIVGLQNQNVWGCTINSILAKEKTIVKFSDLFPKNDIKKPSKKYLKVKVSKWKLCWKE